VRLRRFCTAIGIFMKTMASNAPIGVFDSGLGGLSVLHELVRALPQENFIYVADSGHCPYGGKTQDEIVARASVITDFLLASGAKLIVVACNTATIAAVEYLRATYSVSFVGMEPAVKPAVAATRSGIIGVLATGAALKGEKLLRLIDRHASAVTVITQPCPGLVEQVERGDLSGPETRHLLTNYTQPLLAAGADTLVLGCTHYPFLRDTLVDIVGPDVRLLDTGEAVARRVETLLARESLQTSSAASGRIDWYTSGEPATMAVAGARLWGAPVSARTLPQT
jgi:glutamate racemase